MDDAAVAGHLAAFGPNAIEPRKPASGLLRLAGQLSSGFVLLLGIAAVISLAIGQVLDAVVIAVIVAVNAVLGAWQEGRAGAAAAAVRKLLAPTARVVRNGAAEEIAAEHLVPGDVVLLRAGDRVPADGRLLATIRTEVDESLLTGESVPVAKDSDALLPASAPIASRQNTTFSGTTITRGSARLLVTGTGTATELGQIAALGQAQRAPKTPLQVRLDRFATVLLRSVLAVCVLLAALSWLYGSSLGDSILVGISLAVAAVPEGLPAVVTVTLALGLRRLAEGGAIVRRLVAVETLGSTTVICSDKTGTLTENRMALERLLPWTPAGRGQRSEAELLGAALLASELAGDPGEAAISKAARAKGIDRDALLAGAEVVGGEPFDSTRKRMSIMIERSGRRQSFVKGAPETMLPLLDSPLAAEELGKEAHRWARAGIRVLLVAAKELSTDDDAEQGLEALGLVGLTDPLRPGAAESVERTRRAGVRTVMITGDHPGTAAAIAAACRIVPDAGSARVLTGPELELLDPEELARRAPATDVFARVVPEQKLRIVESLRANGEVVAMTGDGVNDVPGLVSADIGVAMGRAGTDAAAEAADIVLSDDNYSTIVAAIEAGRGIYQNILRFSHFLLAANSGEVMVFALAVIPGLGAPLTVLQILLVNLLTDGLPALALALDPPEPATMRRPPRPREESLLKPILPGIMVGGVATGLAGFASFLIGEAQSHALGQTMAFTTLVFSQLSYVFAVRGSAPFFRGGRNRLLIAAVLLSALIASAVLAVPGLAERFGAVAMDPGQIAAALGLSLVPFAASEILKAGRKREARAP